MQNSVEINEKIGKIPEYIKNTLSKLESAGFEACLVGGSVRDMIMGSEPYDFDIATNALPDETKSVFADEKIIDVGEKHGTIAVVYEYENVGHYCSNTVEITTYRSDGVYSDKRRPESVEFLPDIGMDLARRDFTINAMALKLNFETGEATVIDGNGGIGDIEKGVIRCVGIPERRFAEDALRIMRAVRFSSVLGFEIESETFEAMLLMKKNLVNISAERIRAELDKTIVGKDAAKVLRKCREIIAEIIPEIRPSFDFDQRTRFHKHDVWEHTMVAFENTNSNKHIRLTILLHDIAKPSVFKVDREDHGHFYGHAEVGAEIAKQILLRLKYDGKTIEKCVKLIKHHDDNNRDIHRTAVIKRLIGKLGTEDFFWLLDIKHGDNSAKADFVMRDYLPLVGIAREKAKGIIERGEPCSIKDLAIDGKDMMALGLKGKDIKYALQLLINAVIDGDCENNRRDLVAFSRTHFAHNQS